MKTIAKNATVVNDDTSLLNKLIKENQKNANADL